MGVDGQLGALSRDVSSAMGSQYYWLRRHPGDDGFDQRDNH